MRYDMPATTPSTAPDRGVRAAPACRRVREERDHAVDDLVGAVGDGIGPAAGGIVLREDYSLRLWQTKGGPCGAFRGWAPFSGDHQNPISDVDERRRVETARHT
jgi:hypothetical protein